MHFLFGTGVGLIVLWLLCAGTIDHFRRRWLEKRGIKKEQWYLNDWS